MDAGKRLIGTGSNAPAGGAILGALFGAGFGLLIGPVGAIVPGLMLKAGAPFFVRHMWIARVVAGIVCGTELAIGLALFLARLPEPIALPLPVPVLTAFALGAATGSYSAGFIITGDACTVVRRMRVGRPI